jgi:exonuclease III
MEKKSNRNTGNNKYLLIITLNVNELNSPIKRHRLSNLIKRQYPSICCLQEIHLTSKDTHRLKMKGWKKLYWAHACNPSYSGGRDQESNGSYLVLANSL